jgi:hypothetical protein
VALDAHPKHTVALGAARIGQQAFENGRALPLAITAGTEEPAAGPDEPADRTEEKAASREPIAVAPSPDADVAEPDAGEDDGPSETLPEGGERDIPPRSHRRLPARAVGIGAGLVAVAAVAAVLALVLRGDGSGEAPATVAADTTIAATTSAPATTTTTTAAATTTTLPSETTFPEAVPARVHITSSSDWMDISFPNEVRPTAQTEVALDGPTGSSWGIAMDLGLRVETLSLEQPLSSAEAGSTVELTVDLRLTPADAESSLPDEMEVSVRAGCLGTVTVEVLNAQGAEPVLVATGNEPATCAETSRFTLVTADLLAGS